MSEEVKPKYEGKLSNEDKIFECGRCFLANILQTDDMSYRSTFCPDCGTKINWNDENE